jgi:peptide/nickel transport system substrate-binding protein
LKEGMVWSDGTPISSQDILSSLKLILSPSAPKELAYYLLNIAGADAYKSAISDQIDGITLVSTEEVLINLVLPDPFFKQRLLTPIVPSHIYSHIDHSDFFENNYQESYISCGPYILTNKKNDSFFFESNPHFHLGCPKIERMEISLGNSRDLYNKIWNDEVDFAEITYEDAEFIESNILYFKDNFELHALEKPLINFLIFNHNNQLLKNKNFRKAIAHAIDKQTINDILYGGYAENLNQYYSNLLGKYKGDNIIEYQFDIEYSKEIINSQKDLPKNLWLRLGCNINNSRQHKMAQMVSIQLEKTGIKVELIIYKNGYDWKKDFLEDRLDMFILEYQHLISPDPSKIFGSKSFFMELIKWECPENEKIISALSISNINGYKQWSNFISDELPVLFLFSPLELQFIRKNVCNLKPSPRGLLWNIHELEIL